MSINVFEVHVVSLSLGMGMGRISVNKKRISFTPRVAHSARDHVSWIGDQ